MNKLRKFLGIRDYSPGWHGFVRFGDSWNHIEVNWHTSYWYLPFSFSVHDGIGFFSVGVLCFDIFFKKLSWMRKDYKETTVETLADLEKLDGDEWDFVKVKETGKEYMYINSWIES